MLHEFNGLPNVWAHVLHERVLHPLDVRLHPEYVHLTTVIYIFL